MAKRGRPPVLDEMKKGQIVAILSVGCSFRLAARYVGRNVGPYLGPGTPSAVTYVWCGPHWVDPAI